MDEKSDHKVGIYCNLIGPLDQSGNSICLLYGQTFHPYIMEKFSLILSTVTTSLIRVRNVKDFR